MHDKRNIIIMKKAYYVFIFSVITGLLLVLFNLKSNNKSNLLYQNAEALSNSESGYNVDCITVPIDIDCEVILELVGNDYRVIKLNNAIKVYLR